MIARLHAYGQKPLSNPIDVVGKFGICLGLDGPIGFYEMDGLLASPLQGRSCGKITKS